TRGYRGLSAPRYFRVIVRSSHACQGMYTSAMPRTSTTARPTAHDAALAQQQLAGDRYTKAYVSALETGIARPSMVALTYLSQRLGLPPSHFLDEQNPAWTRLEV